MINLFYKTYDFKMTLGAKRDYEKATNRCLWRDTFAVLEAWDKSALDLDVENAGGRLIATHRLKAVCDAVPYKDAIYMFKSMIDGAGAKVGTDEIDDAMFRSGITPSDRPDECGEPWPIVLVELCSEVNRQMADDLKKKP